MEPRRAPYVPFMVFWIPAMSWPRPTPFRSVRTYKDVYCHKFSIRVVLIGTKRILRTKIQFSINNQEPNELNHQHFNKNIFG